MSDYIRNLPDRLFSLSEQIRSGATEGTPYVPDSVSDSTALESAAHEILRLRSVIDAIAVTIKDKRADQPVGDAIPCKFEFGPAAQEMLDEQKRRTA